MHTEYITYETEGHATPPADDDNEIVLEPSTVSLSVSPHRIQNGDETVCDGDNYHLRCVVILNYCVERDSINDILNNMA